MFDEAITALVLRTAHLEDQQLNDDFDFLEDIDDTETDPSIPIPPSLTNHTRLP